MTHLLTDFDEWYDEYDATSPQQQYEMVREAIAQPIPPKYAQKIDLGSILIEVWDMLHNHNLVDEALAFVETLQTHHADLYRQEFQYFDGFLVQYHLFQQNDDALPDALSRFKADPITSIDQLIETLDNLQFYGVGQPLDDLCRATFQSVATSQKLVGGTEVEIGLVVIGNLVEAAYLRGQQGEAIDWEKLWAAMAEYGFENVEEKRTSIQQGLTGGLEGTPEFFEAFKNNRGTTLFFLMLAFCRFMDGRQMRFVCSQAIWMALTDCLEDRKLSNKQLQHPDSYFAIAQNDLDVYLGKLLGSFLSSQQANGFAILWGIPHVYEFLETQHIITAEVRDGAIAAANALKGHLIQAFQRHLWEYDFVHRWQKPDCIAEADFVAEAEQFAASIQQREPLSDEPLEQPSFDTILDNMAAKMGKQLNQDATPAVPAPPPAKPALWPPKPRKSPLQEAKEMSDRPAPPKNQKKQSGKKKKGFS